MWATTQWASSAFAVIQGSWFKTDFSIKLLFSWYHRHVKDEFVKCSRDQGFRARSAFKLLQILETFPQLYISAIKYDARIVDLGAAPGSWSQVLSNIVPPTTKIVAIDLLPIKPIKQVQTIAIDFTSDNAFKKISEAFGCESKNPNVNLIVSDLCANLSGNSCVDNSNNLFLWKLALNFANTITSPSGNFLIKYFESKESSFFRKDLEKYFDRVVVFKPSASRSVSSEKYFVCLNKR